MELWKRIAGGDEQAVAIFCDVHRPRCEFICYKRGVPSDDCQDVAQDAIAAAACQIQDGSFRGESSLETWLARILYNKIADYWRRKGREVTCIPLSMDDAENENPIERFGAIEDKPEISLMVEQALGTLPEEHRVLLLLNAMEGYTAREIALMVGRSEGRVGALIAEAKNLFRIAIRQPEDNPNRRRLNSKEE